MLHRTARTMQTSLLALLAVAAISACGDEAASTPADTTSPDALSSDALGPDAIAPADTRVAEDTATPADTAVAEDTATPADTAVAEDTATPADTAVAEDTATPADTQVAEDTATPADTQVTEDTATPAVTFAAVHPIFAAKCASCHTTGGSGGANLGASNIATAYADSQESSSVCPGLTKGACALVRILNGTMPKGAGCSGDPATDAGKSGCLTAAQQETLEQWIDDGQLGPQ